MKAWAKTVQIITISSGNYVFSLKKPGHWNNFKTYQGKTRHFDIFACKIATMSLLLLIDTKRQFFASPMRYSYTHTHIYINRFNVFRHG